MALSSIGSSADQLERFLREALGVPELPPESKDRSFETARLHRALNGGDDPGPESEARGVAEDLHEKFRAFESEFFSQSCLGGEGYRLNIARWPEGRSFALFLSHDIDQIHDRELFRILADLNHVRRRITRGEPGNVPLALRRVGRALVRPKPARKDFETILEIEGAHGFRSTFFLLHDRYWARQGARYSFRCEEIREIARMILKAGGELGLHGGYYRFNRADLYRESAKAVEDCFGVGVKGIRNHLLRFSYPETWRAQAEAGFEYDATYGYSRLLGPRSGLALPFWACDLPQGKLLNLLELPLAVMDTTLFRHRHLGGEAALSAAWGVASRIIQGGGLVTLLWHNNFFNEPEYAEWQAVYAELLKRLAALRPWCATGAEINRWWRARSRVRVSQPERTGDSVRWIIDSAEPLKECVFHLRPKLSGQQVRAGTSDAEVVSHGDRWSIRFARLNPHEPVTLTLEREAERKSAEAGGHRRQAAPYPG